MPVRIDDRSAASRASETEFDLPLSLGVLFWMNLVALAVIAAAL